MPRLGVLGWPVAHSRSPAMFAAAFAATGRDGWSYQRLPVPPELFEETVRALAGSGFAGANVTIPHKAAALRLADEAEPVAARIGAANTLTFAGDGRIGARNTDAPGLHRALAQAGADPRGRSALVLGAGGSARAAVVALLDGGASEVAVWNRTSSRARALCAVLGATAVEDPGPADLLVNCTAIGLAGGEGHGFESLPLALPDLDAFDTVADLVYGDTETALVAAARARGLRTVDGLEMLVAQGALAFEAWTGDQAPLEAMRAGARARG